MVVVDVLRSGIELFRGVVDVMVFVGRAKSEITGLPDSTSELEPLETATRVGLASTLVR